MNPLARVDVEWHGDTPVAAVDGEVDASNVGDVAAVLRQLVTNRSNELVVDLSPTSYLDSAGINLLFALGDELRSRQLTLRIVIGAAVTGGADAGHHRARPRVTRATRRSPTPSTRSRRASGRRRP